MTKCLLKLCAHRDIDSTKCAAPAMRQSDYCRHHRRVHRPPVVFPAWVYATNPRELQAALSRTLRDLCSGVITTKFGGQILHEISKQIRFLRRASPS
jgi:hypothetical protein